MFVTAMGMFVTNRERCAINRRKLVTSIKRFVANGEKDLGDEGSVLLSRFLNCLLNSLKPTLGGLCGGMICA